MYTCAVSLVELKRHLALVPDGIISLLSNPIPDSKVVHRHSTEVAAIAYLSSRCWFSSSVTSHHLARSVYLLQTHRASSLDTGDFCATCIVANIVLLYTLCPLDVHGSVLQYVGSSVSAARYRIYTADTSPIALIEDWTGKYLRQVNLLLIAMFYVIVGLKFTKFNFCWGSLPSAVPCCHFATGEREQRKLPAWCANRGENGWN